ncbi:hypothetical protein [Candidatus Formimonas warabiya]|uniref:hypothetical protein n=1 Tax=Formimonas warabiya TaxID=1761012 RepID=UPI001BE467F0|nr:hypothetical protein [Candidatus Formimonas warabiya]
MDAKNPAHPVADAEGPSEVPKANLDKKNKDKNFYGPDNRRLAMVYEEFGKEFPTGIPK